ncbi:2-oxo acid dehydrogenase subunit E2 [Patescibacteria group bacterium]|nr:2-oxo acid dehydrogenase subunit E2 [Patescibacteria group bacterium]
MAKEFKFPDLGEGIEEGQIVKWYVKEGDKVKEHQVVGEVETEKAVAEIPSPFSGTILKINFKEGDTVKVGETLFVIGEKGEKVKTMGKKEKPKIRPAGAVGYLEEAPEEEEIKPKVVLKTLRKEPQILATPAVRKLAKELDADLAKVTPTGESGRITEKDVRKAAGVQEEKPQIVVKRKYDMWGYIDRVPLKGIRKSIAKHMVEAVKHAPHVTVMDEFDATELVKVRGREKKKAEKLGIRLTYLPFLMKALVPAMKEFPLVNASFEEGVEETIIKKYYNFGFAVDVDGQGLIVPVLKGVDLKNILDVAKELKELGDKARQRKLDLQDLRGGTFTITNFGSIGSIFATPIINYPEVAILGVGRMKEKPIVLERKIEIRPIIPFSLSFDHRVLDGAYAIRFLNALMLHLQNPEKLLKS